MPTGGYNFAFRVSTVTFAYSKMNKTPREHFKIITLNEHTPMTVRDIATAVGEGKSSVSRLLRTFQDSGSSSPKRKRNVVADEKLLQELRKF